MIETVFLDQFISLLWGSVLALTAYPSVKKDGVYTKYFWRAFLFQIFIFFPIGLYLFLTWPDWSWMYWVNNDTTATWIKVVALSGYIISFLFGYIISGYGIKKGSNWIAYALSIIGILGILIISIVGYKSLIYLGTYEEFFKEVAPYAWQDSRFVISAILIGIYFGVPGAYLIIKNLHENGLLKREK